MNISTLINKIPSLLTNGEMPKFFFSFASKKVNAIKPIPKGKLNYSFYFSLLMGSPDVNANAGHRPFCLFSPGKEEGRLGSDTQTFRKKERGSKEVM